MVCKFCGAIVDDGSKFCGSCGNVLESVQPQPTFAEPDISQNNQAQEAVYQQYIQQSTQQHQAAVNKTNDDAKKKNIIIVAIVAAVLAIIAVVMIIVLFSVGDSGKTSVKTDSPQVEEAVSKSDAEKAVNDLLANCGDSAFSFVYCNSLEDIKGNKLNYLCDDLGTFYSWTAYTGVLTNGTLKASDIMTQSEYDTIIKSGAYTWSVFKAKDIQAKLDGIYGVGKYKVQDLVSSTAMVTESGYLLYDEEPVDEFNVNYFGKVVSCSENGEDFVVEANILRCDNTKERVYDEATEIELSMGTVEPGQGVDFDSIVSGLEINKGLMGNVKFTFGVSGDTLVLKSVSKPTPAQAGSVNKVTTTAAPQISGEVISVSSYGRYVKAGGGLNIRALPSIYAAKVSNIPNGTYITVIGKSPYYSDWVYVSYGSYYGWVNSSYLVTYQPTVSNSGGFYATVRAGGGLNIRSSPGGSKIGNVPNGSSVYVYYYNDAGTWAYINYGGYYGWVSASYLY